MGAAVDFVEDVGDFITDEIIEPVVDTVENIVENPAALATVALSIAAPGVGTAIGSALGASGAAATALGNAVIGGTLAEASGGDFVEGAVSGGVGSLVGGYVAPELAAATGSNAVGQALTSGAMSELQGGDFLQGAITGGISGAINDAKLAAAEEYLKSIPPGQTYESDLPTINVEPEYAPQDFGVDIDVNTPFYSQTGATAYIPNADGTTTYTWDDGSTITVDPSFNLVSSTGATDTAYVAPEQQQKDISGKLAALDAAKALAPMAVGALTAGAVVNAISEDQPTGYPILPVPSDWASPQYNMAFTPSAPIDFGSPELLRGTQWEKPITLSSLINTLNQPFIAPETQLMMTQFQAPTMAYETGVNDIIGNIGGKPVSIADIISGIQSGQTDSGSMG